MTFFELEASDISNLSDGDLRELVARLCEAELIKHGTHPSCVYWGGAQEAADGGIDVSVRNATSIDESSFVPRKNIGFQVKKHTMGKSACINEMMDDGVIKPVIAELLLDKGAYIIVSGKDDCSDQMLLNRLVGMKNAVDDLENKEDLLLDFYGRDRLATWLRQFPGVALWVRLKLGKPLSGWKPFGRWAATPIDKTDEFLMDDHPCVTDMNSQQKEPIAVPDGIQLVRDKLRDPGSVVRITGLSGVGKTRFAQALFEAEVGDKALPTSNVIYADLGENLQPTASELITYLTANDFSAYVVLDNCNPEVHRQLQKQVSASEAKLSLLTIEYDISDDKPEETDVIHIEPSSEANTSKLIQIRFPDLGRNNADKVASFAGGNARVAVALASRVEADETLTNFTDEELFQRLFSQRKGIDESLLESAEILSLVYSFNVSRSEFNDELDVLSEISGLERRVLMRNSSELLRRQLSQKRGNWRAILPHALSNRLARRALQNYLPEDINSVLFKPENIRLFKSCAHRLGYLHDFEPARALVGTWMAQDAPLSNLNTFKTDKELLGIFDYIAPVLPEAILLSIEEASKYDGFCSKNNENFSVFIRLLRQLAYDDSTFERASRLILKFAETEDLNNNNSRAINTLESLFSLHLSGTHATPERRQSFLNTLITSENQIYRNIAYKLFESVFTTSHWTSYMDFNFGARKRDYGWEPKTREDIIKWYEGFINILIPLLESEDLVDQNWAKDILANNFRGLWSYAGCFDILEEMILKYGTNGNWPQIWLSIKETIYYDKKEGDKDIFLRLQSLEHVTAPSDLLSEIKAYALEPTWEHADIRGDDYSKNSKEIQEKIVDLGKQTIAKKDLLEELGPLLWITDVDALSYFGEGLALGSEDHNVTFEYLVQLMQNQKLDDIRPGLFYGFIRGVNTKNKSLARSIQERVLEIEELMPYFIYLLASTPIEPWGSKMLIELAKEGKLEAWRFERISYGGTHKTISDNDLSALLSEINNLEKGVFSTIQILSMRFHRMEDENYAPSENILSIGRATILRLLSMYKVEINSNRLHGLESIVSECLSSNAPIDEVNDIVDALCDGIVSLRFYNNDISYIINGLVESFIDLLLDKVFSHKEADLLSYYLFKDRIDRTISVLNKVPIKRLVQWCNGDQSKIQKIASSVTTYVPADDSNDTVNNPKYKLSEHIFAFLEISDNKAEIIEIIFSNASPSSWSGSRADIIEARAKAFAELLNHSSLQMQELTNEKLIEIEKIVQKERKWESDRNTRHEQRFE